MDFGNGMKIYILFMMLSSGGNRRVGTFVCGFQICKNVGLNSWIHFF